MINNIQFVLGNGNLGRPQPGYDYVSGYMVYSNTVPSGFSASVCKQVFSISNAESLGILSNYSDETKASTTIAIAATGSVGDSIKLDITEPAINGGTSLKTFTYFRQASDTTTTALAANVVSSINGSTTGYSATSTGATVSLFARPGMGASMNGGVRLAITNTGTISATTGGTFSGGVSGNMAIWHYQISEFFRMNPNGVLWVGFYPTGTTTFSEINDMQVQADGQIRQFAVESSATSTSVMLTDIDKIQDVAQTMFDNYTPASIVYSPNFYAITDLSTLPNLRAKSDNYVSVVIGQDGGNLGAFLSMTCAKSVSVIGAALGTISLAKVSEDIAWVQKFNLAADENDKVAFINTSLWSKLYSTAKTLINQLDNYGYIFMKKLNNVSGSYFNDSHCAVSLTSDYAYIENNRTIDKAIRNAYLELSGLIAGPVSFKPNGSLSDISIATFETAAKPSLDAMVVAGELSAYSITVDPNQNVQSTSTIVIVIKLLGIGVARNIQVQIGYTLSI